MTLASRADRMLPNDVNTAHAGVGFPLSRIAFTNVASDPSPQATPLPSRVVSLFVKPRGVTYSLSSDLVGLRLQRRLLQALTIRVSLYDGPASAAQGLPLPCLPLRACTQD